MKTDQMRVIQNKEFQATRTSVTGILATILHCMLISSGAGNAFAAVETTSSVKVEISVAEMEPHADKNDLLSSLVPQMSGLPLLEDEKQKLPVLTDGLARRDCVVMPDNISNPGGTHCTLTYTLPTLSDIHKIQIFSFWGDIRAYQNYEVEIASGSGDSFTSLVKEVKVGKHAEAIPNLVDKHYRVHSTISAGNGEPVARKVKKIRFTFWGAGHVDPAGTGHVLPRKAAKLGSAISEIDVIGIPATTPDADADRHT